MIVMLLLQNIVRVCSEAIISSYEQPVLEVNSDAAASWQLTSRLALLDLLDRICLTPSIESTPNGISSLVQRIRLGDSDSKVISCFIADYCFRFASAHCIFYYVSFYHVLLQVAERCSRIALVLDMQRHPTRPHLFMGISPMPSGKRLSQEDRETEAEPEALETEFTHCFPQSEDNGYELCSGERSPSTRRNGSPMSSVPTDLPSVRVSSPPPRTAAAGGLPTPGRVPPASLDDSCSSPSGPPAKRARATLEHESDAALRVLIEREQGLRALAAATTSPIVSATLSSSQVAGPVIEATTGGDVSSTGAAANASGDSDPTAELLAAFVNSEPDRE